MKTIVLSVLAMLIIPFSLMAQPDHESDVINTSGGDLKMFFINHGTLMFSYNDLIIHIDPVSRAADYSRMPDADLILVTHQHGDHLDKDAIEEITKANTTLILTQTCRDQIKKGSVMKNGDTRTVKGLKIRAVPAYNIKHRRDNGKPYHPKGQGNGYVITFGDKKVYVAGDTENVPEMKELNDIDIAFLPMNLPYTMSPEMVAEAVNMIQPDIMYPYHYGQTDTDQLVRLLEGNRETQLRIRDFYR